MFANCFRPFFVVFLYLSVSVSLNAVADVTDSDMLVPLEFKNPQESVQQMFVRIKPNGDIFIESCIEDGPCFRANEVPIRMEKIEEQFLDLGFEPEPVQQSSGSAFAKGAATAHLIGTAGTFLMAVFASMEGTRMGFMEALKSPGTSVLFSSIYGLGPLGFVLAFAVGAGELGTLAIVTTVVGTAVVVVGGLVGVAVHKAYWKHRRSRVGRVEYQPLTVDMEMDEFLEHLDTYQALPQI